MNLITNMKKMNLRLSVLMVAMTVSMMGFANQWSGENRAMLASAMSSHGKVKAVHGTQDFGGRVIDEKGDPMPFCRPRMK